MSQHRDVGPSRRRPIRAVLVVLVALIGATSVASTRQATGTVESPCDIQTAERVVAVGDVHGAYDGFVGILREAGLVDRDGRWSGGRAVLVQTGDALDRGPQSRKVIDLLRRLELEAPRVGGRVLVLLGNHEAMRILGDRRYVSAKEYEEFRDGSSSALRERTLERLASAEKARAREENRPYDEPTFMAQLERDVPLGLIEMTVAFAGNGEYGRWVRSHHAMVKINGVVFVHGGVSPEAASRGCEGINAAVATNLELEYPTPTDVAAMLLTQESGPLWYRGLSLEPEHEFAPALEEILRALEARAIVVGHTVVAKRITTRFDGRVIQIDTGMLGGDFFPGGGPSALELRGTTLTAVYGDRREIVPAPWLQSVPSGPAIP